MKTRWMLLGLVLALLVPLILLGSCTLSDDDDDDDDDDGDDDSGDDDLGDDDLGDDDTGDDDTGDDDDDEVTCEDLLEALDGCGIWWEGYTWEEVLEGCETDTSGYFQCLLDAYDEDCDQWYENIVNYCE